MILCLRVGALFLGFLDAALDLANRVEILVDLNLIGSVNLSPEASDVLR